MSNITQNIILRGDSVGTVFVGYMGEKESRGIAFDFAKWQDTYGAGALQLLLQRPGDQDPYPVALEIEGTVATWTPNETDTAISGQAKAQLIYTVDGAIAKTAVFTAVVQQSLGAETDPPDPYETWLESLVRLGSETLTNAQVAKQSAESAAQSAERADNSADAAFQSESNAKDSEIAAKASEEAAAAQALDASRSAATATGAATTAQNYATTAAGSATSAASSASEADASRVAAASAAQVANQAAITANSAAGTASAQATAAAGSAATATQKASDASASAASAAASASSASGSATSASGSAAAAASSATSASASADRAQSIVDDAEAGIDAAKDSAVAAVGAAGTAAVQTVQTEGATQTANAKAQADAAAASATQAAASATAAGNAQTASETAQGKAEDAQEAAETAAQSIEDSAAQIDTNTADIADLKSALNEKAGILRDTVSGSVASFVPDATVPNLLGLSVALEPIQDLHGYDSPWPAGGGKNILPTSLSYIKAHHQYGTWDGNNYIFRGITWTIQVDEADNVTGIIVNGTATQETSIIIGPPIALNGEYLLNGCPAGGNGLSTFNVRLIKYSSGNVVNSDYGTTATAFTSTETVRGRITIYGGYTANNLTFKPMLRLSSVSDASYSPYSNICPISGRDSVTVNANGTTYTIQLGDTTYGGDIGVVSGDGESKMGMVDMGTLNWIYTPTWRANTFYAILPTIKIVSASTKANMLCEQYKVVSAGNLYTGSSAAMAQSADGIRVADSRFSDAAAFKAVMSGVQLCYELATPVPISTTPTEISTVEGENNVFSPDGDVTVEYAADLKTYIDSKIAAAVAALS